MEEKIVKLLKALVANKRINDTDGNIYALEEVGLKEQYSSSNTLTRVDITDLDEYEIYIDSKDLEIEKLKETIKIQHERIEIMMKPKTKVRKPYVKLNNLEIDELCKYAQDNPKESKSSIARRFEVYDSYVGNLLHSKKVRLQAKR